jgi:hypothetical protein
MGKTLVIGFGSLSDMSRDHYRPLCRRLSSHKPDCSIGHERACHHSVPCFEVLNSIPHTVACCLNCEESLIIRSVDSSSCLEPFADGTLTNRFSNKAAFILNQHVCRMICICWTEDIYATVQSRHKVHQSGI